MPKKIIPNNTQVYWQTQDWDLELSAKSVDSMVLAKVTGYNPEKDEYALEISGANNAKSRAVFLIEEVTGLLRK